MMTTEDMQEFDTNQRIAQGEPVEAPEPTDADPAYADMSIEERNMWLDEHAREEAFTREDDERIRANRWTVNA